MPILSDLKKYVFSEEVDRNKGVNQSTWRKIGGMINFLGHRTHEVKRFTINGAFGQLPAGQYPFTFVDGVHVFEFDAEIFNIWTYNKVAGGAGITELDLKTSPVGSLIWTSILSTTAKILPTAAAGIRFKLGDVATGVTAPVINGAVPFNVNAGDAIRMDLITAVNGVNGGAGMIIHFRPR